MNCQDLQRKKRKKYLQTISRGFSIEEENAAVSRKRVSNETFDTVLRCCTAPFSPPVSSYPHSHPPHQKARMKADYHLLGFKHKRIGQQSESRRDNHLGSASWKRKRRGGWDPAVKEKEKQAFVFKFERNDGSDKAETIWNVNSTSWVLMFAFLTAASFNLGGESLEKWRNEDAYDRGRSGDIWDPGAKIGWSESKWSRSNLQEGIAVRAGGRKRRKIEIEENLKILE